jgi:hypothetical protein
VLYNGLTILLFQVFLKKHVWALFVISFSCSDVVRHLKRKHLDVYMKYEQHVKMQVGADGLKQSSMASYVTSQGDTHYGQSNPRQRSLTKSLILNVIVQCNLPVSLVDNPHFRAFLAELDPKFTPPCRQTVTYTILPQLLESQKAKVRAVINSSSDISLTADIWTDRRSHAFLAVTFHLFKNGQPVSGLLDFRAFGGSHTGVLISEAMESMISDYGIGNKIRTIVTDNAANMRKALSVLLTSDDIGNGNNDVDDVDDPSLWEDDPSVDVAAIVGSGAVHLPCFAHSIQLVVRDGLSTLNCARTLLAKCCKLSNLLHQSALFRGAFEKAMGDGRSIPAINDTRWNSVSKQLSACLLEV